MSIKKTPLIALLWFCVVIYSVDMSAQNIGISNASPNAPLSFADISGNKIDLFYNSGTSRYGLGIQAGLMQLYSNGIAGNIAFGYGSSSAFTELMRITGTGYVGVGNINPIEAGLVVDKKAGAVHAMFGSNTTGVSIESNYPGIGLNSYYNGGRKTIATGYAGWVGLDPVNGNLILYNSNLSTAADAASTIYPRLFINKDGNIGIEGNTSPHAPLCFANTVGSKISLFGSSESSNYGLGIQGALLQLYTNANSADIAFGYGGSSAFTENMRIRGNGNVGIGTNLPLVRFHVVNPGSIICLLENSTALTGNVTSDLYFKTGTYYTGAIKTIGQNISAARLGFFTNASTGTTLVERMSILDNGNVGIGTTTPGEVLDVVGNGLYAGRFVNTTSSSYGLYGADFNLTNGTGVLAEGGQQGIIANATVAGSGLRFGIYASASGGTTNYAGYFNGDVYSTGLYLGSDQKLKSDIQSLDNALMLINKLRPSTYKYKTDEFKQMNLPEGIQYGLIAGEVMEVLPGLVKKTIQPASYENHDAANGRKLSEEVEFNTVNYTEMIPILIGAIQEQQTQIDDLKNIEKEQQQKIDELIAMLKKN